MKTLKEWFDNLSPEAQRNVELNCNTWFDKSTDTYYRDESKVDTGDFISNLLKVNRYSSSDQRDIFAIGFLSLFKQTHTEDDFKCLLATLKLRFMDEEDSDYHYCDLPRNMYQLFDTREEQKEWFTLLHWSRTRCLSLHQQLFLVDDFDKMEDYFDLEHTLFPDDLNDIYVEIFGKKIIKGLCKEHENKVHIKLGEKNDLFDELFFCPGGWTEQQKRNVLKFNYVNNYRRVQTDDDDLQKFQDFIKRIVCVDKRYLSYMYEIIDKLPALGNKVYEQKKPDCDLKGDEQGDQVYRYNKTIRKLAKLANICSRKSLSKVNGKLYKEVAPLVKIYGYDFNTLYAVVMDEDDEQALNN